MAALSGLLIAGLAATAMPAPDAGVARWRPFIAEASSRFGVPEAWIMRVMRAESAGLPELNGKPIRSRVGAIGLMQLMPTTWSAMRATYGLGADGDDPRDNILAGAAFLRLMFNRFGFPGLFAAYNVGPARYAEHLATGRALPAETRNYLVRVTGEPTQPPSFATSDPRPDALFAVRNPSAPAETAQQSASPKSQLFVALGNH